MSLTIHCKYKYFDSTVQRAEDRRQKFYFCRLPFAVNVKLNLSKGTGKRGHIVADTLLPTQMFPRLPARATFVADTNFVPGTQKYF